MITSAVVLNMVLALLITLALILGLALVARYMTPTLGGLTANRRLRKVESLSITPQHTLHLLEIDGVEKLVMTTPTTAIDVGKKK